MKAFLMYQDRDFDPTLPLPVNEEDLIQDLELNTLFNAMAQGDQFIFNIVQNAILTSLNDPSVIRYRQDILKDCLKNQSVIRELYQIPLESIKNKRKSWLGILTRSPSGVLSSANDLMVMFVELLKRTQENRG